MRLIKILGLVFILLFSLISVYSVTDEDLRNGTQAYYTFDEDFVSGTTLIDSVGNFNATCNMNSNCDLVAGKINNASDFDGINDYITRDANFFDGTNQNLTISYWVKQNPNNQGYIMDTGGGARFLIRHNENTGQILIFAAGTEIINSNTGENKENWNHYVITMESGNNSVYINGDLNLTSSTSWVGTEAGTLYLGARNALDIDWLNGTLDEFSIWNEVKNASEVQELYNRQLNNQTGAQYDFTSSNLQFQNITANNQIFTNNSFWNTSTLNFETIVLNTSTNGNVNQTYNLYYGNGTFINTTQYATNNLTGLFTLNLSDGQYHISFFAENNETNVKTNNYTFNIDTSPANVSVNAFTEWNDGYNVTNLNTTLNITCEDPNLVSCNISWDDGTMTDLLTTQYKVFSTNGNHSFNVTATDIAGNQVTASGVIFINPVQRFNFNDEERSILVNNYNFGDFTVNSTTFEINLYDLGLGSHTLLFEKLFYVPENFTFTFNTTSNLNITYNVTPVDFSLRVFDEDTLNQISFDLTVEAENGSLTQYNNQFNFSKFSDELPSGNLTLRINKNGYSERKLFVFNDPFNAVSIDTTLLNSTQSTAVIFEVIQSRTREPIENAKLQFFKIKNGTETFAGEAKTDEQGLTFFNMDALDEYEIVISKNGFQTQTFSSIPGKTEYTILLSPDAAIPPFFFSGLSYVIKPKKFQQVPFTAETQVIDSNNKISAFTFTVTGDNTSFTQTKTSASGGTISFNVVNFSNEYTLNLTITREGVTKSFIETLRFFNESQSNYTINNSAYNFLQNEEDPANRVIFMIFIYILAMVTGAVLGGLAGGSGVAAGSGAMAGVIPILYYTYVGFLSLGVGALIIMATVVGVIFFKE